MGFGGEVIPMPSFLEYIGVTKTPTQHEPNGKKKWGTTEYKFGLVYVYCTPEDRERVKFLASELKIPMNLLIHRLLHSAEIAIPNKTKVLSLDGKAFWEMFEISGVDKDDKP